MKTQFRLSCSIFWLIAVIWEGVNSTARYHTGADGRIYLAEVEQKYKWLQAFDECASRDMQLVVIDSLYKKDIVYNVVNSNYGGSRKMFIGHHDEFSRDRGSRPFFSAATGNRIDYAYWTSGNPDNNGRDEHCVIMKNNDYRWNDVQCGLEYGYMCEEHHLTGKYKTNLEQKRQNVYQKNTKLSSDFLNSRNTIQNIITNAGTSTDSTFARHSKSTENIFNEFNESLYKILQKKPYMEVVLNEIREDLEQQELETKQKLLVLSEQTSRELNEINTSAKTSSNNENAQFATKITQNTNEIHAILIF